MIFRKKKGTMRFYFCRNCNSKNNHSREVCVQCGRSLEDRMVRALK